VMHPEHEKTQLREGRRAAGDKESQGAGTGGEECIAERGGSSVLPCRSHRAASLSQQV
jgi:hypothetical protein